MTLKNRATRIKNTVLLIFVILFVQLFPLEAEGQTSSDVFPLKVMTFNIGSENWLHLKNWQLL